MRPFRASVLFFAFLSLSLLSTLTFAVQPDRIAGEGQCARVGPQGL